VSDTGIGFDSKYREDLFKKFTNQGRLGTANESSTGIGLYLCKKIIEKYKGKLLAESAGVNKGASFSVVFEYLN
jgi:signal transduction histidine kinase